MINPMIVEARGNRIAESNCGSLLLAEPIEVIRHNWIRFTYYNRDGLACEDEGYLPTVQHEVDHNNGILITERRYRCTSMTVSRAQVVV